MRRPNVNSRDAIAPKKNDRHVENALPINWQGSYASADSEASHAIPGMFVPIFESKFGDA